MKFGVAAGFALLVTLMSSGSVSAKASWIARPEMRIPPSVARVTSPESGFILPVSAACISSPFGMRHIPDLPQLTGFHNGVDLPAPIGAPILAVGPGTLIRVQRKGPGGLEMLIQHHGFIAVYSHLGLIAPAILEGNRTIHGGERIGTVGMSGLTIGPHLFFAMIINDHAVDPAVYLGLVPCGQKDGEARDLRRRPTRMYAGGPALLPATRGPARSPASARQAALSAPN